MTEFNLQWPVTSDKRTQVCCQFNAAGFSLLNYCRLELH
nr:MAG TPA: hypothetical protein [Caudoviricetes sp.]